MRWYLIIIKRYNSTASSGSPPVYVPEGLGRWCCEKHSQSWLYTEPGKGGEPARQAGPVQLLSKAGNAVFALVNTFWFLAWQWFWWINRCPPSIPEGLDVMAESDFCAWMNVYVNHFMSVALLLPCTIKIHCSKGFCIMGFWSPSSSIAGSCIYKRNSISHQWHLQHLDAVPYFGNWQWNPLAVCKCVVCLLYNLKANV